MNTKNGSSGLPALVWIVLACFAILILFSGRFSSGRPETAAGRAVRDAALSVEELSLPRIEAGDTPAVVRQQLIALKKRENEEWTDRNIRRNPALYLEHCKELLSSLREDLLDAQFGAHVERTRLLRVAEEEKESVRSRRAFLAEAEKVFSAGSPFPVEIDGFRYGAEAFTNAVREADAAAARAEKASAVHAEQAERARELADYLDGTLAALADELDAIPLEIDALKAQEARDAAEAVRSRIGNVLDGVHVLARPSAAVQSTIDRKDEPSLSDIFSRNRNHSTENNQ